MSVNTAFETSDLPKAEFMFPGPERDRSVKLAWTAKPPPLR